MAPSSPLLGRKSFVKPTRFLLFLLMSIIMADDTTTCEGAAAMPAKVIVTGAGGQTGQALFRKLLALPQEFEPLGLVRTPASKAALVDSGIPAASVAVVDVTQPNAIQSAVADFTATSTTAKGSLSAFCICTSAKPKPTDQVDDETGRPVLGFPDGSPQEVDWIGQKQQIDACPAGTHIVVCSSMGGTDPNNRLNSFGRVTLKDGSVQGGNILLWKRKAEVYLVDKCAAAATATATAAGDAMTYTIVHPGGLQNEPGGEREVVVGVDDLESGSIPRDDVAQVMLAAVRFPDAYKNRSFDIRAKPVGEGTVTADFESLLEGLKGRNCDYSLGEIM
jgi:hypothetical protein